MEFNVLGPRMVVDRGVAIPVPSLRQRAVLTCLLLRSNELVSTSDLMNALWGDAPPVSARKCIQNAVSSLRTLLPGAEDRLDQGATLLTYRSGYMLQVDPEQVDVLRFKSLLQRGRAELAAGRWRAGARVLREALGLWKGPTLAELLEAGLRWPELHTLQNSRLDALEDCTSAELFGGRHREVLAELEASVRAEPRRERLCGLLMVALYRCGRQVEALEVYRKLRETLVDELGLEPGAHLQELESAILQHGVENSLPRYLMRDQPMAEPAPERSPEWSVTDSDANQNEVTGPDGGREEVLLVVARLSVKVGEQADLDGRIAKLVDAIRREIIRHGGTVVIGGGLSADLSHKLPVQQSRQGSKLV